MRNTNPGHNARRPAPAQNLPASSARETLRRLWRNHRHQGSSAVIAAFADAAAQEQVAWRRPGHAADAMAHARATFAQACRDGWLEAGRAS